MKPTEPILTLHLLLAGGLMLFLAGCQPTPTESPRPAAVGANRLAESVCDIWAKSQPTWTDADTPRTIDEIDYSYRVQEATCAPIQGDE